MDPLVFGLLALDRRGVWRWRGQPVRNDHFSAMIQTNYHADTQGRWYVQNGDQKLFIDLAYTPWVLHMDENDHLRTQTSRTAHFVKSVWFDESGTMLLDTEHGPGILREDALFASLERLCDVEGRLMCDNPLDPSLAIHGTASQPKLFFRWNDRLIPVGWVHSKAVSYKFRFVENPGSHVLG